MDTLRDVMESAFFDELEQIEKTATASALWQGAKALGGKALAGGSAGKALGYFGTRAGIGAGAGAVAGGATSRDGNFARGAMRGALVGGALGAGVGAGQVGHAAYKVGRHAMTGAKATRGALGGAGRTLQQAGMGSAGMRNFRTALKSGHWLG